MNKEKKKFERVIKKRRKTEKKRKVEAERKLKIIRKTRRIYDSQKATKGITKVSRENAPNPVENSLNPDQG